MPTERDRYYTKPPSVPSVSMIYGFSPTAVTSGINPGTNPVSGVWLPAQFDASGRMIVAIGDANITGSLSVGLNFTGDSVTAYSPSVTTASNYTPSGTAGQTVSSGLVLPANSNRIQTYIQNIGSGSPLFVKLGQGVTTGSFSLILGAASSDFGANGGVYIDNGNYKGDISVSGQTRFIAWQLP